MHIITGKLDAVVLESTIKNIAKQRPNVQHTSVLAGHEIAGVMQTATVKAIKTAIKEAAARDGHAVV